MLIMSTSFLEGMNFPPQTQQGFVGLESQMTPQPKFKAKEYVGTGRLKNKVALITGGDSGIGRAVAVLYAREGANVCINFLPQESEDAEKTKAMIQNEGGQACLVAGNLASSSFCSELVEKTIQCFGKLDILVMAHGTQLIQHNFLDITDEQLEQTFAVNVYTLFYLCRAAVPRMSSGSSIITTSSVAAFKGDSRLIDYSSSEGAVIAFTRGLSIQLSQRDIRVNCVVTGDVWTPLIPSSYPAQLVPSFGHNNLMDRAAQPEEISPAYVFLASLQSSYISGQCIHLNGGIIVNT